MDQSRRAGPGRSAPAITDGSSVGSCCNPRKLGILNNMTSLMPSRTCTRCVMDTSDPAIRFDSEGVCNHCHETATLLADVEISAEESNRRLEAIAEEIRAFGRSREYDSILGVSGGVDSSYVAYLAHRLKLRPLIVHCDNGWNSELAVQNISQIVDKLGLDLHTYVIDWEEFRDLQRSFFLASVIDIEILTDHAITAVMFNLAREHGIGYVLSGQNIATENGMPRSWI
ncbi:MAG: hypothetical protein HY815_14960, partial [Candidatus Riflebacteria bacterium]|nr:hypothetical protein [Candidatus Riflebacteria bacterium]